MKIDTSELLYKVMTFVNTFVPKRNNSIFIYDGPYMRQNCWALLRYLTDHQYNYRYKITYYTNKEIQTQYNGEKNVTITSSLVKGAISRLTSKYIFFEYNNFKFNAKRNKKQISFNIWHGMPIKCIGYLAGNKPKHPYEDDFTYVLVTSEYFKEPMKKAFNLNDSQLYFGGYPRNDDLFFSSTDQELIDKNYINILWMPTFRKSSSNNLVDLDVELPIINADNIDQLNDRLAENRIRLVIKAHPFQDRIMWLEEKKLSNITVMSNKDFFSHGLELYQAISLFDGLITDYSSIYFDYLLTGKPILFAMDDFKEYSESRGFVDENMYSSFEYPIAHNFEEFVDLIVNGMKEKDYETKEKLIKTFMPKSKSDSFTRDLLDFLTISH